jgi:hypothetical protein
MHPGHLAVLHFSDPVSATLVRILDRADCLDGRYDFYAGASRVFPVQSTTIGRPRGALVADRLVNVSWS